MIAIVMIVFISVAVLLSTFIGFSPNFYKLTQSDFRRRINFNTVIYGLQMGEVALRAKTLANPNNNQKTFSMDYIKKKNDTKLDSMGCKLTLSNEGKVQVKIDYKSPR